MTAQSIARRLFVPSRLVVPACVILVITAARSASAQVPYSFLQPGMTQELVGATQLPAGQIFGGVAFTPSGDVWVDSCNARRLFLFLANSPSVVHGTTVHTLAPGTPFSSNAGCGLTNHPDGTMYSNAAGLVNLDAATGAQLRPNFGPLGNGLGIAVDPQTNHLVYVGIESGRLIDMDPVSQTSTIFAQLSPSDASFIDGIFFDPTGNFLFLAVRTPSPRLTVLSRNGSLVQHVLMTTFPDGVAFHQSPSFVVANNNDGSITRFDFPSNDYTQAPVQSILASGGFRGDLAQVGPDGCLYVTQAGTRYLDGTVTTENSVVRICPNFIPAPGLTPVAGRMDGGGTFTTASGGRVHHGFELHCTASDGPNNLEINWGTGERFKLQTLTAAVCTIDTTAQAGSPRAAFNTIIGTGIGAYKGVPDANIEFSFTDGGEPGAKDRTRMLIRDSRGNTLLSHSGPLDTGNYQAH